MRFATLSLSLYACSNFIFLKFYIFARNTVSRDGYLPFTEEPDKIRFRVAQQAHPFPHIPFTVWNSFVQIHIELAIVRYFQWDNSITPPPLPPLIAGVEFSRSKEPKYKMAKKATRRHLSATSCVEPFLICF